MPKSGVHAFYLAVFALFSGVHGTAHAASPASSHARPESCALEPKARVEDACATYADLNQLNHALHPYVRNLANNTDFFSYYRLNLYNKKCPFWDDDNGLCGNRACAVITLDNEEDIPEVWRAHELSKLEGPKAEHPGKRQQKERQQPLLGQLGESVGESCVVEYDDECDERDYCVPEDESVSAKGDYVSLVENPERFTGYSGEGAHHVWESIYRENCFSKPQSMEPSPDVRGQSSPMSSFSQDQAVAALELKQVIKAGQSQDAVDFEDECLEKRVFYRVISGMHASISTHLCYDYLNQMTGEWGPNLTCYKERLHNKPDRISNLYFNFALVSRAIGKLRDYVQDYTFCTGDPVQDQRTKKMILSLARTIPPGPQIFDESVMFRDPSADGLLLKEDFRNRFRNVSRIMDCVGCDKCRLWGKVQTNGFGTALKVLFEFGHGNEGDSKPLLRRTELVALVNTLDKISAALKALEHFQSMIEAEQAGKSIEEVENTPAPSAPPHHIPESPRPNFDELNDLDDFGDDWQDASSREEEQTLGEIFWEEFHVVFNAWKFVLRSWIELPVKLPHIFFTELLRGWDFWIGKPVRPRNWEFRFPSRDEL